MKIIPDGHEGNAQEEAQSSPKLSHKGGQRVNLYTKYWYRTKSQGKQLREKTDMQFLEDT